MGNRFVLFPYKHENGDIYLGFSCPGCKRSHYVDAVRWHWNGDLEKPTFSPSLNCLTDRCHFFVKEGIIEFCPDSAHELAGQSVPLTVLDELQIQLIESEWEQPHGKEEAGNQSENQGPASAGGTSDAGP